MNRLKDLLYPQPTDCLLWHDHLTLALNVIGNLGIMFAYIVIPAALILFALAVAPEMSAEWARIRERYVALGPVLTRHGRFLPYEFGAFIILCGATHGYTVASYHWHTYFQLGILECITAVVSSAVALHLVAIAILYWWCKPDPCRN